MTIKRVLVGAASLLALSAPQAEASIVTLDPVARAYVTLDVEGPLGGPWPPNPGHGVGVGRAADTPDIPLPNAGAIESRSIVQFDLGAIVPATLSSASLRFTVRDPDQHGVFCFNFDDCPPVAGLSLSFFSGTGTVVLSDFHAGGEFLQITPQPPYDTANSVDVTELVALLVSSGGRFPSFRFTALTGPEGGAIGITDLALRVEHLPVPEPSTLVLLGLAMSGSMVARRC